MARGLHVLSFLSFALAAAPLLSQIAPMAPGSVAGLVAVEPMRMKAAEENLLGLRGSLGLDGLHTFALKRSRTDDFGYTHGCFQQLYRGVPVFEATAVTHMEPGGTPRPITDALLRGLDLSVEPSLTASEALVVAHTALKPKGSYARQPQAELVIFPERALRARAGLTQATNADDFEYKVLRNVLAFHVQASLRNPGETKEADFLIDAHTGQILKAWDDLHTATATGKTQYSGTRSLTTSVGGEGFTLTDAQRGGTTVNNMDNATSGGTLYTQATNAWGDGGNYFNDGSSGSTKDATGQTTAVDAQYGFQITWDYYKNVFGRDGIDGRGAATALNVHYDKDYNNAYWDDSCFCMTFGDGSAPAAGGFRNLTAPDVIGHELSHGVCANNGLGGLTYSGESGGLNEANSDIQGNFVVLYGYNGGTGTTVPEAIPEAGRHGCIPWTIGSQLSNPPLRYMYKPSLDGSSADSWSESVGSLDVHHSSGPANRMVFFLSQGATLAGDTSSIHMPKGMKGIGNDHSARIWYRALTTYFTPGETYAQARAACMTAASDLYGEASPDYAAVQNAFAAINVGAPAPAQGVDVTLTPATATLRTGGTFQFTAAVTGAKVPTVAWTTTGGTVNAKGLYKAPGAAGTYTVTATSTADATRSATATVTVTGKNAHQLLLDPGFEEGRGAWTASPLVISSDPRERPYQGAHDAWLCGVGEPHTDQLSQTVAIPASAASATLTYQLHVDTAETAAVAYDFLKTRVLDSTGTVLATLETVSNLQAAPGYQLHSLDLSAFKGRTVQISFTAIEDASLQTSFVLDDVNLNLQ